MTPTRSRLVQLGLSFCLALFSSSAGAQPADVDRIARGVAEGVGTVGKTNAAGTKGTVFVFEEYHTSRVGQLQIAVMLLRLHERHRLTTIGLEGAIQTPRPLDGVWFHTAGGPGAASAREDVALRMLAEGEISSAEFLTLVLPKVRVFGTELQEEYNVKLDVKSNPQLRYLLEIAKKSLTQADIQKVNALAAQKKTQEALDHMLTRDPWVRQHYDALKMSGPSSTEGMAVAAREVQARAQKLAIAMEPEVKADMEKVIRFFDAATKRSDTMVNYVLGLPEVASGAPVAMIIGAAHTDRVLSLLRQRGTAFAQLTPTALNPDYAMLTTEQFDRKNKGQWARIGPGTLGALLNPRRKPSPCIGTATCQSGSSMKLLAILAAEAVRAGKRVPESIWESVASLPELRVDRASFAVDGYDIVFRAWLKRTDGTEKEVWARVGTADTPRQARTLEPKLLQSIADLGGGSTVPPRKPPRNSQPAKDEGPGDGKRGDILISREADSVLAVYADTKDAVNKVGQISG